MDDSTKAQINKLEGNKPKFFLSQINRNNGSAEKKKEAARWKTSKMKKKKENLQIFSTIDLKISTTGPFALVSTN